MMNQETYDYVLEILSREPSFNEGIRQLKERWSTVLDSISEKTLKSIQAQYYVRRMRRNHFHHYSRDTREKYYHLYKDAKAKNEKNVIMRLAAKNDISPCLLARIILEEYYWNDVDHERVRERNEGRGSLPPGFMTDCIRDIAKLPNPELAKEIYETMLLDNFYGPAVDSIKKSCGVEYEIILKAQCRKAGLSFIDESQMREEGYDKTPDIRLKVPVMINKRVVNWIESKASFGDPINHQQYMIDQYLPYKNRFGPGAVIYWFGFVQELAETGERGILLLSGFPEPEQILHLKDMHHQEKESVGLFLARKVDTNASDDNNSSGLGDLEMDSAFSNYVDPMFDSDEEDEQTPGFTVSVETSCIFSDRTAEGSKASSEKHYRGMDSDTVRITRDSLHVSEAGNHGESQGPPCVTVESSFDAHADKRSPGSPKSHGDGSVCLDQDNSNDGSVCLGKDNSNDGSVCLGKDNSNDGSVCLDQDNFTDGSVCLDQDNSNDGSVCLGKDNSNDGSVCLGKDNSNDGSVCLDQDNSNDGSVCLDQDNSNDGSVCLGKDNSNDGSVCLGKDNSNDGSVCLGKDNFTDGSVCLDQDNSNDGSVCLGKDNSNDGSVCLGKDNSNDGSVCLGKDNSNDGSVCLDQDNSNDGSVCLDQDNSNDGSVCLGKDNSNDGSVCLDQDNSNDGSVCLGKDNSNDGSVYLGKDNSNDDSVCLGSDNSNDSTTDIVSGSDNRLSSRSDISGCERVNEHWDVSEAVKTSFGDTNFSGRQNLHQGEINASCNKFCDTQDDSISLCSRSAQRDCPKPSSAMYPVDCVKNGLLLESTSALNCVKNSPLCHDKEVHNKSRSFIYSDQKNKKRKPKKGKR